MPTAKEVLKKRKERKFDDRYLAARQREMDVYMRKVFSNMFKEIKETLEGN